MVATPPSPRAPGAASATAPVGAGDPGTDPGAPTPAFEPLSVKVPALVVLGLAVVILLGGVVAAALATRSNPSFALRHVTLADGTTVALDPAASKLHAIVGNGEPPSDIIGNLGVPSESVLHGVVDSDRQAAQFDRTASLTSQLAQPQVIEAFAEMLRRVGWTRIYQGSAPQGTAGSTEILAKRGSSDGYYWEVGVVVSPTTAAGSTPYSIEVFETTDGN